MTASVRSPTVKEGAVPRALPKELNAGAALPPDVRKRYALPFRLTMNSGLRPNKLGVAQNQECSV